MAKGNMLLGKLRGKLGDVVFTVLKGEQVSRPYNGQPNNPRTYSQQAQRALLANMVKFYRRATSNFYKFAFEDKTQRESDYNAYARNNIMRGAFLTKEQVEADGFPAVGRYMMTKGSLGFTVDAGWMGDWFGILIDTTVGVTVANVCRALMTSYPAIQEGDLVTFVAATSAADLDFSIPAEPTSWNIVQFYVDLTDTRLIGAVGLESTNYDEAGVGSIVGFNIDGITSLSMGAVCVTRKTPNGLLCSNSFLVLSPLGQVAFDWLSGEYHKRQAAISWGGNPEAILAGGLLSTMPQINYITIGSTQGNAYIRRDTMFTSDQGLALTIARASSDTTTNPVLKLHYYGADQPEDNNSRAVNVSKTITLTVTSESTAFRATIPNSVYNFGDYNSAQGFYSLELNGVVICYGTMLADV